MGEEPFLGLSILVVDDDLVTLELVSASLASLHVKRVVTAVDGQTALAHLVERAFQIDVIICDLDMPRMDGLEFLRHALDRGWNRAVIFMSGTSVKLLRVVEVIGRARSVHALETLAKPATSQNLAAALRRVIARPRPAVGSKVDQAITRDDLIAGIANGQLFLEYQPKIDLRSGSVVGCEALVRWSHPNHGRVNPAAFISFAEDQGLIHDVTSFVIERGMRDLAAWRRAGLGLSLSVNISSRDIDLELPGYLQALARKRDIPAGALTLELTESAAIVNLGHSLEVLARCRLKGFGLSIDDFGTGFSSLEKLSYIPFTELKIDRQFVQEADRNPAAAKILEMSAKLARDFGIDSVAEGVETRAQLDIVRACGCTAVQGFYFAKPMAAHDLVTWSNEFLSEGHGFAGPVSMRGATRSPDIGDRGRDPPQ